MASLLSRLASVVAPPFCWGCGADAVAGQPLCAGCRRELRWLDAEPVLLDGVRVWAPVAYEGPARSLVRGLKYRGAPGLADPMAAQIAALGPADLLEPPAVLVPVPLHPSRRRKRGFNQAEKIAVALGGRTGLDVVDCLRRGGGGRRQVGRGRSERLLGPEGSVTAAGAVPAAAVLVDDVATTGATLAACAAALIEAGSRQVAGVTYARTPGR